MYRIGGRAALLALAAALVVGCPRGPRNKRSTAKNVPQEADPRSFSPPKICANCHVGISVQYFRSMHSQSLSNPVFRAHYYREFLPLFHESPIEYKQEPGCLRCHGPVPFLEFFQEARARITAEDANRTDCKACHDETDVEKSLAAPGVICDICHRIEGFDGDSPGNGNYVAKPGRLKFGPFEYAEDHHRQYNELQTKSEICGVCHNSVNRHGLEIRSTFAEWKESRFSGEGMECQDCHMVATYLGDGKVTYESGKAAYMTVGEAPHRDKLYTHRFYGAHSRSQVEGALTLEVTVPDRALAGEEIPIRVLVHNEKTGHKMPTGSVELRAVWLEVTVRGQSEYADDTEFELRLVNEPKGYAVAGDSEEDARILGDEVPRGVRVYRAVFNDPDGNRTLMSYDAKTRVFDNRLEAGEVREELFEMSSIGDMQGWVVVEAKLHYLRFPKAFADKLRIRPIESIEFARGSAELLIGSE